MKLRHEIISEIVRGKRVLDVGCADHGDFTRRSKGLFLHDHLRESAAFIVGVDTNKSAVQKMQRLGYSYIYHNYNRPLTFKYDYIVIGEVLEHQSNAYEFLKFFIDTFPLTRIIITVPNAFALKNFIYAFLGKEIVNPDHTCWYSKRTIITLLIRLKKFPNVQYVESYPRRFYTRFFLKLFPMFHNTLLIQI